MTASQDPAPPLQRPASLLATTTALQAIDDAVRSAVATPGDITAAAAGPEQALACLLLLRQIREQLASWESGLIASARDAGASWADLAAPLGVASRQAAERRYLRLRPGAEGSTGEQRVQAVREGRAADRTITAWARDNAADLRRLAARITALADLPAEARTPLHHLDRALAADDAAALISPLQATRPHLQAHHPDLAARIDTLADLTRQIRTTNHGKP
jgi:hypothetical protein